MKAATLTKETILTTNLPELDHPEFRVGDTIEVGQIVKEGNKERIQIFAGDVIAMHRNGISSTFTVRKIGANNVGVEKIFPNYSPVIDNIKLVKRGRVRRAKLYYLRDRIGKAARIKEKVVRKADAQKKAAKASQAKKAVEAPAASEQTEE